MYQGYAFEIEDLESYSRVTVRRFSGDAVSATTRYRIDPEGRIGEIETATTGPGNGLMLVVGALGGGAVWLLWAIWHAVAWLLRRKPVQESS